MQAAIAPHGLCPPEKVGDDDEGNDDDDAGSDDEILNVLAKKEEQRACLASPCFNFQWVVR